MNIEFWLSRNNPLTNTDGGVYAEFMGVWGWNPAATWWNCTPALNQSVTSSGKTYDLCHQSDTWGSTFTLFQFEATGGSQRSFTGSVDIKAFLDWFFGSSYVSGATKNLWLTRIELGTEIGDDSVRELYDQEHYVQHQWHHSESGTRAVTNSSPPTKDRDV